MPVYNAETTVSRMIDSILAQTMTEWELIAVDDGSTDASSVILDAYAEKDCRVKVFHKCNEGVAMARQLGVNIALGEYSIHADADDWMEADMLEDMYNKIQSDNADILIVDFLKNSAWLKNEEISCQMPSALSSNVVLHEILFSRLFGALWNKMMKTSLYRKYNVKFYKDINFCEDVLALSQILKHADVKISYYNKAYYHYYVNENSVTKNITRKVYENLCSYLSKIEELLSTDEWRTCIDNAHITVFITCFQSPESIFDKEINSFYRKLNKQIIASYGIRWRVGFFLVSIGCYSVARKILKY